MAHIDGWEITDTGIGEADIQLNGSRFLTGNGCLGYRGTVEEADADFLPACGLSGIYDRNGDKWREPVNAPNPLSVRLYDSAGNLLSIKSGSLVSHAQKLDFRYGVHSRNSVWRIGDTEVRVTAERFASMADTRLLCLRYSVVAGSDIGLRMEQGIDCRVWDINGPHFGECTVRREDAALGVGCLTRELSIPVGVATVRTGDFPEDGLCRDPESGSHDGLTLHLRANMIRTWHVFAAVCTGRPGDASTAEAALRAAGEAAGSGYARLMEAHRNRWDGIWENSDVEIDGDDYAQAALRYSMYHLHIIAPRHSDSLSIPARGLSGQTYKGAVFWDTEMFISPFFLHTEPEVARGFIRYRIRTLDGARRKASEYGYRGAFYAWESQENGDDACSLFNVTDVFTGRPMRTYFRDRQIHISADVVYAIDKYVGATGDSAILEDGAMEVILECARFFLSYAYYSPGRKRYEILDVTGPDEYHERVGNNAFTNRMVLHTLRTALACLETLEKTNAGFLDSLLAKIGFVEDLALLRDMAERLYVPAPGDDLVIEQFDRYLRLEDCGVDDVRSRVLDPKEYWGGANGVASGTRIIKQADVIMLLSLFGTEYPAATKQANLAFYGRRTEHGSSLSACVHALLACDIGDSERAYPFFIKTAEVDITGDSKQFAGLVYIGGTHPAANGGAWMTTILGFCGLSVDGGTVSVSPRLPKAWTRVRFTVVVRGVRHEVTVTKEGSIICVK